MSKDYRQIAVVALCITLGLSFFACRAHAQKVISITVLKRGTLVSFDREILPILQKKCVTCHSASEANGELVLESPSTILKGGETGPAVVAKDSDKSLLLKLASHREEPFMPPLKNDIKAENLTSAELGLIKLWIDQGAQGSTSAGVRSPTAWRALPSGLNPIYAVAVTPDGQYAACGRANQIFIYHVATGQVVTRLTDPKLQAENADMRPGTAHLDVVQSLAFNNQGDLLASGGFRVVKLWRRPSDVRRLNFAAAGDVVTAVAVSPDGTTAATGAADNSIKLWSLKTGEPGPVIEGHTAAVTSLQFAKDGANLISSSKDKTIRVWNATDGTLVGRIDSASEINAITLVDESVQPPAQGEEKPAPILMPRIASGGADNFVRVWAMPESLDETLADVPAKSNVLAVSPDRKLLAIANAEGTIRIIDFETRKLVKTWKAHEGAITDIAFRVVPPPPADAKKDAAAKPIIRQLATSGADKTIRLWNYDKGEALDVLHGSLTPVDRIAYQPDGKRLVSGTADGKVTIWNLEAAPVQSFENQDSGTATVSVVSPDGKRLATSGKSNDRNSIIVRDVTNGNVTHTLLGHDAPITSLAFSVDNTKVVSGSADKSARVWNLSDGKFPEIARFAGHTGAVNAVAFNSDAQQVLSGSADNSVKLWKVADETEVMNFAGHTAPVVAVAMAANNQPISASADKTVRVWNPADGKQVRAITEKVAITAMAISRDGIRVAVAGADNIVKTYQISNAALQKTLTGHQKAVTTLSFSADNVRLVSGSADNTAIVWNVADGRLLEIVPVDEGLATATYGPAANQVLVGNIKGAIQLHTLRFALACNGIEKSIHGVAFNANGQVVYAASEDGTVRGFNATNGQQTFSANHAAPVHDLALSSDGTRLASAGEDKLIKMWNAGNGAVLQPAQLAGFTGPVKSLCFSSDNQRVIGAGSAATGELFVFNIANGGELEQSLVGHSAAISNVTFAGEANARVISASADESVRVWPLLGLRRIAGHSQPVNSLATIPTVPMQIISGSNDATVRHWNLINGQALRQMNHGGPVTSVAVRSDGQRFASASANNTAKLWNAANGQQLAEMRGDIRAKNLVAKLTQQEKDAAAKVTVATAAVKAATDGLPAKTAAAKTAADALVKANQDVVAKAAAVKKAADTKAAAEKVAIEAAAAAQKAALAKAEADLAALVAAELVKVATEKATRAKANATASPDDTKLAQAATLAEKTAADAAAKAKAADAAKAAPTKAAADAAKAAGDAAIKAIATNKPFVDASTALRQSETAQKAAAQASEFAARDAKAATDAVPATKVSLTAAQALQAKLKAELEAATKAATEAEKPQRAIAFSPDNRTLATGGDFNSVHTWNADNGLAVSSYVGHDGAIHCLTYASEGGLVTGSADKSAAVWDLNPGWVLERTIGSIDDPSKLINRVAAVDFSDDGKLLCTGGGVPSRGGEVKIWNVADGTLVRAIPDPHTDAVFGVEFSRDGNFIATASADKYVRTFEVATGKSVQQFEGHTNHALSVSWKADGKTLASSGADSMIRIWNAETGDRIRNFNNNTLSKQISMVRFIGETATTIACSGNSTVQVNNIGNGAVARQFAGEGTDYIYSVDATPNGQVVVAGGYDSILRIWTGTANNAQPSQAIEPPNEPETAEVSQQADTDNKQASK